jgi:hypothetical protein
VHGMAQGAHVRDVEACSITRYRDGIEGIVSVLNWDLDGTGFICLFNFTAHRVTLLYTIDLLKRA